MARTSPLGVKGKERRPWARLRSSERSRKERLGLLDEALRDTRGLAAQIERGDSTPQSPVIDAALALGRLTGLTGQDEVVWLRACLAACTGSAERPGNRGMT